MVLVRDPVACVIHAFTLGAGVPAGTELTHYYTDAFVERIRAMGAVGAARS
jgi:hypothetical protein